MALNLPPDPYKVLGVAKDAKLPEIRSAHRKLVLKCHPDKVQDAALKAIKQDEFQNVQEAYELLSDDTRRIQYDENVKLFELRKEMGRGNPTPRSNPFEYEIRTAEPRSHSYSKPQSVPRPQPKVYTQQPPPRSYEDVIYEEPTRTAKKSASYESTDRRRPSTRDGGRDYDRHEGDETLAQRWEKERKRAAHGEKKKSRDKEKRRGTEEKHSSRAAYVEDDSDGYAPPPREKKSSRHRIEEEIRIRNEEAARNAKEALRQGPLTPKWDGHKEYAAEYMQAARRKAVPADEFHHPTMRRAETFGGAETKYNIRYATPQSPHLSPSDDEAPRRSSARTARKVSETPPTRSRDVPKKEHKRSPSARNREPYIVEPPSPIPPKTPKLQSHSSAPPQMPFPREKPSRSKTTDYPRQEQAMPPLPRAKTFQAGDRDHGRDRDRDRGSRLKKSVNYASSDSEPDSPPRHSHSPPAPRRRPEQSHTKYIIDNGRSIPISRHRSEMGHIDDEDYRSNVRERSESPRGARHAERPPLSRNPNSGGGGSRQAPQRSHSQAYYPPDPPEPVILTARPKMPARETGSHRVGGGSGRAPYFGEVNFAPKYGPEHGIYTPIPPGVDVYGGGGGRRGSEGTSRDYYPSQQRGRGDGIYAG